LAHRVRDIAERPDMAEKKRLWTLHNDLKGERPMVFCDPEHGWHEVIPESTLECSNDIARHWNSSFENSFSGVTKWGMTMS
jgi:predicted NAD/FAD-binding protein